MGTRFDQFKDEELKSLRYALETAISELDWSCKDNGQELALLDEVNEELGHRFNEQQLDEQYYSGEGRES